MFREATVKLEEPNPIELDHVIPDATAELPPNHMLSAVVIAIDPTADAPVRTVPFASAVVPNHHPIGPALTSVPPA